MENQMLDVDIPYEEIVPSVCEDSSVNMELEPDVESSFSILALVDVMEGKTLDGST